MEPPDDQPSTSGRHRHHEPSQFADTLWVLQHLPQHLAHRWHGFDRARATERLANAVVRGAIAGGSLRGGLNLVSLAVGLLLRGRGRRRGVQRATPKPPPATLLLDTLRWAAFLGTYSGVIVAVDELIAMVGGKKRTRAWRGMAAGMAAGPTLLLTGGQQAHTSVALYVLIRGLALLVRCGNLPTAAPWKRAALAPTRLQHGDVALICLATMQLGYSWIVQPSTLPASYVRFLNKHGGKRLAVYEGIRELVARNATGAPPAPLAALAGTPQAGVSSTLHCPFLHPGQTCNQHAVALMPEAYLRSIPVYLPVYLIPALLVHRQRLLGGAAAPALWRKLGGGVLRSSLFLSLFVALAWRGVCAGVHATGALRGDVIALSCWTGGLATLVEKKARRMELALYCLSRAAESAALCLGEYGIVPRGLVPRRVDVLMFGLASACILHCYSDHLGARRCVFRSRYLAVFDWVLGNRGFHHASIHHHPSNADLLDALESRLERQQGAAHAAARPALHIIRSVRSVAQLAGMGGGGGGSGGGRSSPGGGSGEGLGVERAVSV